MLNPSLPAPISIDIDVSDCVATSPDTVDALKARLEAARPPPSPEKAALKEARATALRTIEIEGRKDRAARQSERVAEAEARRLRAAAAEKQKIARKAEAAELKVAVKKEEAAARAAEAKAKADALADAVREAREQRQVAREQRSAEFEARGHEAATRRGKSLQAVASKGSFEVKHALAVAAAVKEKTREEAEKNGQLLLDRLHAAEARRGSPSTMTPPSSSSSSGAAVCSFYVSPARGRARQVAQALNSHAVGLLEKGRAQAAAMEKAASKREAALVEIAAKARASNERAAERAKGAGAEKAADEAHALAEKLQAAEVRRLLHQAQRKPATPSGLPVASPRAVVIDVAWRDEAAPASLPPAHLLERLNAAPQPLLSTAATRQARAADARAAARAAAVALAARRAGKAEAAAERRGAVLEARKLKMVSRAAAGVLAVGAARATRSMGAAKFNGRVRAAAEARAAADAAVAGRVSGLDAKREARRLVVATARAAATAKLGARREAASARLAAAALARGDAGASRQAQHGLAHARRATLLSARVARAKLSATPRSLPVKLTLTKPHDNEEEPAAGAASPEVTLAFPKVGEA